MSRSRSSNYQLPLADELAAVSARMSGLLLSEETVDAALALISSLAQETVPGSSGAGVSIVDEFRRRSAGSTDERVRRADTLQYQLDEGPCLAATADRRLIRIDDLGRDPRWPTWAAAVLPLGLQASMSAPMVAGDTSLGAVKVYADEPGIFDDRSEQLLTLFSGQAAVLVAHLRTTERSGRLSDTLRQAIHGRDLISMAKGVLMGRHGVDEPTAFGMLLASCEEEETSVGDAARAIVESSVRRGR